MSAPRHFLAIADHDGARLRRILDVAAAWHGVRGHDALRGRTVALIFEKPSTRTRLSFEVGVARLGGHVSVLTPEEMQLGRGESVADTAAVLGRYVDAIMLRTSDHARLAELGRHAGVPVINGLSDRGHPCQILADIMAFEAHRGPIAGRTVAWCGDFNNVARSWVAAAPRFGFQLRLACPPALVGNDAPLQEGGTAVSLHDDAAAAVAGADAVATDTWISMNHAPDQASWRRDVLAPYRVDAELMARARADAVFLHCLPAARGDEVTADVIDGPQAIVMDEAEYRLHAQLGLLLWCLGLDGHAPPGPDFRG